jgi:hypothetical protein
MPDDKPLASLIASARKKLADTDKDAPLIDDAVWDQAVPDALGDLSRFKPLRKRIDLTFTIGADEIDLPSDFMQMDLDDFNRALKPYGLFVTMRGVIFAFEWISSAATDISTAFATNPYAVAPIERGTTYQLIDDGAGGKKLWLDQAPRTTTTVKTLYHAMHQVRDADQGNNVEAVNTVPLQFRDVLLMRVCYHALLGLAALVLGDKDATTKTQELAELFNCQFEKRVAFAPYGRRA